MARRALKQRRLLILADHADLGAAAVAELLVRERGAGVVHLATGAQIVFAPRFSTTLGGGSESTRVMLARGVALDGSDLAAVLCRVQSAEIPWGARASVPDGLYASSEAGAVLLAWLAALPCPIVNEPSSIGLAGPVLSQAHWLGLATQAGLPCARMRLTTNARSFAVDGWSASRASPGRRPAQLLEPLRGPARRALVVGGRVTGPLPRQLHDAARRLAERARCRVLGLTIGLGRDGEVVTGVDPVPPLLDPGDAGAAAELIGALGDSATA